MLCIASWANSRLSWQTQIHVTSMSHLAGDDSIQKVSECTCEFQTGSRRAALDAAERSDYRTSRLPRLGAEPRRNCRRGCKETQRMPGKRFWRCVIMLTA